MIFETDYLHKRRIREWILIQYLDMDVVEKSLSEKNFVMKGSVSQKTELEP
jgi:hypothetical protein